MSEVWPKARLSDHVDIAIGGTPSRVVPAFWAQKPDGQPWLAISDLRSKYLADTREHITELGIKTSNVKLIPAGSTVMSFKLSVGRVAITTRDMYSNEAIAAFLPHAPDVIEGAWLYHALPRAAGSIVTDNAVKGATLNKAKMTEMIVDLPGYDEQCVVARVLDTLDTTIRQTEAIIAKLNQVKQGLLHDLLTRGIDANGELRPPQSQAPNLYKQSPLGWIPADWLLLDAGQVAGSIVDGPFGSNLKTEHYVEVPGVRVVRLQNIGSGEYDDTERAYVSEKKARSLSRNEVLPGDVLVAALGDDRQPVGRACTYPHGLAVAINKADCFRLRPTENVAIGEFVMHALNSACAHQQVRGFQQGVTMQRINLGNLRRVKLPVPPMQEQQMICDHLVALQIKIVASEAMLHKLAKQKSGLMDDLLTGRVRVTPLLEAAPTP